MKNMMSDTKVMEVPIHFSIQAAEHLEEIFPLKIKCSSELTIKIILIYCCIFCTSCSHLCAKNCSAPKTLNFQ